MQWVLWQPLSGLKGREYQFAGLTLKVEVEDGYLVICQQRAEELEVCSRVYLGDDSGELAIVPQYCGLPVLNKLSDPIVVHPGQRVIMFVRLPYLIAVRLRRGGHELEMSTHDLQQLSCSWFGTPDRGELAHSYYSPLFFTAGEVKRSEKEVVCPLYVRNESEEVASFDRLFIRTRHLAIYESGLGLISNTLKLTCAGGGEVRVEYMERPPREIRYGEKITAARQQARHDLVRGILSQLTKLVDFD
jgi:hypothetical protein